jgi:hypothetical protein
MNIPKAYIGGFQKAAKSPRMLFILYFSNLIMALLLALPFMGFLKNSFGSSMLTENLLEGFNFTAFSNLMYYHKDGLDAILGNIKWILVVYFLLNIFLTGGIIRTLNKEKFTTGNFFSGAAYNFFRFLGLSLIMIVVQLVFILLVYIPLGIIFDSLGEKLANELSYYYWAIGGFTFHLLIFLLISMIGDYAKFYLVLNDSFNIFKGFWKGVRYVFSRFLKTYFLYLFLLFIPAVVMYVYWYYEKDMKMATGIGILIVFAMQQAFIFLRVFLRVWVLSSQFKMYADDFIKSASVQDIVFSVTDTKEVPITEEETIVEEEEEDEPVSKSKDKSKYAIDFEQTFSPENKIDSDEKILTEEEMLKRVEEEEDAEKEALITRKKENAKEELEETIIPEKEAVYDEEEYDESPELEGPHFEEDGTEEELDEEEIEEWHLGDDEFLPEHVYQNVTNGILEGKVEEEVVEKKDKDKKVDDDLIEFEL